MMTKQDSAIHNEKPKINARRDKKKREHKIRSGRFSHGNRTDHSIPSNGREIASKGALASAEHET
jgi:hypothetical protein